MLTDHKIMLSVRDGNIKQLGVLFDKYKNKLYTYFLHATRNRHASEDMVQEEVSKEAVKIDANIEVQPGDTIPAPVRTEALLEY